MKRLGLFGGTFNPVHQGHIGLALDAADTLALEKVLLVPTKTPPHKPAKDLAAGRHRLAMCRLAAQDYQRLEVSDIEVTRSQSSHTITTLEQLGVLYPDVSLFLIVGGDMLLSFDTWHRWQEVLQRATLCAAPRTAEQRYQLIESQAALAQRGIEYHILNSPVREMSSTDIRQKIKERQPLEGYLDSRVVEYIAEHQLYR